MRETEETRWRKRRGNDKEGEAAGLRAKPGVTKMDAMCIHSQIETLAYGKQNLSINLMLRVKIATHLKSSA